MLSDILKILENDSRITPDRLACMTGLAEGDISREIKQAEADKTILKYKTVINWEKLGHEQVFALIEVKVSPQRDVGFDAIAERIYRYPEVRSCYLLSGTYDLLVMVGGKTMQMVANFVAQKLAPIEGVQGAVTHFLLKRFKEDDEIIDGNDDIKREPVVL
ncbi:MAG: transcriptional regulator, AsnC family [Dehalococcoides mccartyi]|jgi:Transcriptional regulators|uniref:AsnC family transcriptional regulator n=3 Tax=root TaxID=1 RepID=A0AB33HT16_9CHLR|nr:MULTISPECIES: Lrp/AsnC family transcriptional regulator [Dehalococcoides]AAW39429.1 transcriptional regulator, AsnC family [Dehalococcoides mccartyi 195]MCF7635737.1 transcriptional regulator, AsnC family [Dehalococcoides mccartyi]MEA2121129.1 hypothetical protein [Dehalococcoides mccartyi]MEA2121944.1 hypothetical protein [Dehalococcoides mccartyi]MEA4879132.1 Lrp/AsnC family transcriptional regulator [Dehalococcoides mccartyi]